MPLSPGAPGRPGRQCLRRRGAAHYTPNLGRQHIGAQLPLRPPEGGWTIARLPPLLQDSQHRTFGLAANTLCDRLRESAGGYWVASMYQVDAVQLGGKTLAASTRSRKELLLSAKQGHMSNLILGRHPPRGLPIVPAVCMRPRCRPFTGFGKRSCDYHLRRAGSLLPGPEGTLTLGIADGCVRSYRCYRRCRSGGVIVLGPE
jgi:hypothetical protein